MNVTVQKIAGRLIVPMLLLCFAAAVPGVASASQPAQVQVEAGGGEASLVLPDLSTVDFRGINGRTLLMGGLVICTLGLLFGLMTFTQLKNLPVHPAMLEVSELIYETCKTYLITQGKFILILEVFIGVIMVFYFGVLSAPGAVQGGHHSGLQPDRHRRQLRRRLVRHPREHVRQLARRVREPARQTVSDLCHPAAFRDEHRHAAHQRRAPADALHSPVHSRRSRGARASSASPSASRSARRRFASPEASSRRSRTSGPTS